MDRVDSDSEACTVNRTMSRDEIDIIKPSREGTWGPLRSGRDNIDSLHSMLLVLYTVNVLAMTYFYLFSVTFGRP
ncbi:hypothetical protein E2542_SST25928 [Spatholobus suberectus]|nr:hypothetical protein E2542_SST25928 [Spatholobus suberectus]